MSALESIRTAFRSLRGHPLRSILTMLGIIIGVGAVVAMVALGRGAQVRVAEQIRTLGANLLMIQPGPVQDAGARLGSTRHRLTEADARTIEAEVAGAAVAAPSVRGSAQLIHGNRNWNTRINGTVPSYFLAREWPVAAGRGLFLSDVEKAAKVALLGATAADALFGQDDPVGREIRIDRIPFKVVGILRSKGASAGGRDQDDIVFIPISTAKIRLLSGGHRIHRDAVDYILVKVSDPHFMGRVYADARALLRTRHRLGGETPDDFRIWDPAAAMAAQQRAMATFSVLLAAIASISLLVGGISIMNIMLVSVTERIREIGIRIAVGARPADIRLQFLLEAVTLCLLGGVIGVMAGVGAAVVISALSGWSVFIGPELPLVALAAATATGLVFGLYPAARAARLSPADALRYE